MTAPRLKPETGKADRAEPVFYPIEDDEPLAESEHQLFPLTYTHWALTTWFADDPTTWVGSDMFLHYVEGAPSKVVAPDVFVVRGRTKRNCATYSRLGLKGVCPTSFLKSCLKRTIATTW